MRTTTFRPSPKPITQLNPKMVKRFLDGMNNPGLEAAERGKLQSLSHLWKKEYKHALECYIMHHRHRLHTPR